MSEDQTENKIKEIKEFNDRSLALAWTAVTFAMSVSGLLVGFQIWAVFHQKAQYREELAVATNEVQNIINTFTNRAMVFLTNHLATYQTELERRANDVSNTLAGVASGAARQVQEMRSNDLEVIRRTTEEFVREKASNTLSTISSSIISISESLGENMGTLNENIARQEFWSAEQEIKADSRIKMLQGHNAIGDGNPYLASDMLLQAANGFFQVQENNEVCHCIGELYARYRTKLKKDEFRKYGVAIHNMDELMFRLESSQTNADYANALSQLSELRDRWVGEPKQRDEHKPTNYIDITVHFNRLPEWEPDLKGLNAGAE